MASPSDRLDDLYLQRKREEEEADLDAWYQQRTAPMPTPTPETPTPGEGDSAPTGGGQTETGGIRVPGRMGRILEEGGRSILSGGAQILRATPPGLAIRHFTTGEQIGPLQALGETASGVLAVVGGTAAAPGVLLGQGAVEEALAATGLLTEDQVRSGAELLTALAVPIAAAKIPAVAKALQGGAVSQRVLREIIGVPEGPAGPAARPPRDFPMPKLDPAAPTTPAMERLRALANEWDSLVETQRRGTRTHEQAMVEGRRLPMTLDEVRALLPGTAMTDAQAARLISTLMEHATEGRTLVKQALASGDEARHADALRHFVLLMQADPSRQGVLAEAGRTLSVMNDPIAGMNQWLDAAVKVLVGSAGLSPEAILRRLDLIPSPQEFVKLAKQLAQPTWKDAFTEFWINSLLSGFPTHIVNLLSNSLTTGWAIGTRVSASAVGVLHGGLQPGEAYHALWGAMQGTKDGWRLAGQAFREGAPQSKLDQPLKRAIRGETFGRTGPTGRAIDYAGEFVRLPTRFLMSSDEFFKGINFRMELHAQAYRTAAEEGLTGKAAATRMQQIIANPPPSVIEAADRFALHQTFQTELTGRFTTGIQSAFSGPVGKLFLPFIKTPTNIFKYTLENTPLAPFLKSWRADLKAGGARADLALAKVALGSSTMYVVTQYAAEGRITGGGPQGPERDEWLDTHQPYSIRWGDHWVAYNRLDPVGMLIGFAADYAEISGEMDERTGGEFALALTAALAKNLTSKTYVKSIATLIEALESPDQKIDKLLGGLSRSLIPRGVANIERVVDPELRDPTPSPETAALFRTLERMFNEAASQVPGWSKDLPPKRNLFGDPIRLGAGEWWEAINPIYVRDVNTDPVAQELSRLRVRLTMPARAIDPGMEGTKPIPLTPQEYDRLLLLAAGRATTDDEGHRLALTDRDDRPMPTLRERLASVMATDAYQRATDGPDGGKALMVRTVVQTYRESAVLTMKGTRAIKDLIAKRLRERGEQLKPAGGVSPVTP